MKKRWRERLPHGLRKFSRRLIVRLVKASAPLARDVINIAATNGLDVQSEFGLAPRNDGPPNTAVAPWNAADFVFLMDLLTKRRTGLKSSDRRIRASIVIPALNEVNHTFNCLRTLLREVDLDETEIIVVNNGSTDETGRVLDYLKDFVRVIHNPDNFGFVRACNQGAEIAAGEYVVFLNNDTIVQRGWLAHLIETADKDAAVGAVGSMLIYPDGSLQEAGGIVWRDGKASHYGWGEHPEDPKFNVAREVDYCSAAALLVRRDLFSELGGFDERYSPAYYEDTDLCFDIRSLGFKVVYQPLARVVHDEGATAGTDLHSGFKRYQVTNRVTFTEKWREVLLRDHWEYSPDLVDQAANRLADKTRIAVFDAIVPTPDQDAGSVRMFMILKSLAKIGKTIFVPVFGSPSGPYALQLEQEGVEVVSRLDWKSLIAGRDCEVAILSRPAVADEMLSAIRSENRRIKVIFDTVDIYSARLESEHRITGNQAAGEEAVVRRKQERRLAQRCDQVWCVTEFDRDVLKREAPQTDFKIVPTIHELKDRGAPFSVREDLLFIGGFLHNPNRDAVRYFVRDIQPLLSEALPGVKLHVVGSNMPEEIRALASDSVKVLGYAPEVDELFRRSRLFVAPLRFGSGMNGKIGQALSYGLPVVTTSIGAEGFQLRDGHEAMIADEPAAFVEAIVRAYKDQELWQHLSDNGYEHVQKHFTPEIVGQKIIAAIKQLGVSVSSNDQTAEPAPAPRVHRGDTASAAGSTS
jgi:O-antigen biosynthesis protein